jgi:type I restriction enzyme R subunit
VASSIFEACRYYALFQATELKGKCAVVTSYNPQSRDITTEETGANTETDKQYIYTTYDALLKDVKADPGKTKTESYEDRVKKLFVDEPANMKLLIVVDKLLTGFDAPSCTYLYIDKSMQDHGLFQAICRVNRLDSEDKKFGFIVDYKDLFRKLVNEKGTGAIQVYTEELDYDQFEAKDCDILMQDRLTKGREWLDNALEEVELLCEKVEPPKGDLQHIHYFCGNTEIPEDLKAREVQRTALYKAAANLIRAYANIGDDMEAAGYSPSNIEHIESRVDHYLKLRDIIKNAAGEKIDLKAYEADMRYLIDRYIQAEESEVISPFADMPILDIIEKSGIAEAINALPDGIRANQEAVAETIENNVRSRIIKNHLLDPAYFEKMSKLLDEIIKQRKQNAINYQEYLKKIADLANKVATEQPDDMPTSLNTKPKQVLYSNLGKNEALALQINDAVMGSKQDGWRDNQAKENEIKYAIFKVVSDVEEVERIFAIVKQQQSDY